MAAFNKAKKFSQRILRETKKLIQGSPGCTQITELVTKDGEESIRLNHDALKKFLTRPEIGNKPIAFISIAGEARRGKSMMMNLIANFIEESGWQGVWEEETTKIRLDRFPSKPASDGVTKGILLCNEVFEIPWKDRTMVIILMDTQGLFAPDSKDGDDNFLLAFTTLISSLEIFNFSQYINTNGLGLLNFAVEFAEKSRKATNKDHLLKLQDLVLLVRDATKPEEANKGLQKFLEDKKWSKKCIQVRDKLISSFEKTELYMIPGPKTEIRDGKCGAVSTVSEIGKDFLNRVKIMLQEILSPERLQPKCTNNGKPIQVEKLLELMCACDNLFAEIELETDGIIGERIMKLNNKANYWDKYREALKEFRKRLQEVPIKDIVLVEQQCVELKNMATARYAEIGRDDEEMYSIFETQLGVDCDILMKDRLQMTEVKLAMERLETTKRVTSIYSDKMQQFCKDNKLYTDHDLRCKSSALLPELKRDFDGRLDEKMLDKNAESLMAILRNKKKEELLKSKTEGEKIADRLSNEIDGRWKKYLLKYVASSERDCTTEYLLLRCDDEIFSKIAEEVKNSISDDFWKKVPTQDNMEGSDCGLEESKSSESTAQLRLKLYPHLEHAYKSIMDRVETARIMKNHQHGESLTFWKQKVKLVVENIILKIEDECRKDFAECHVDPKKLTQNFDELPHCVENFENGMSIGMKKYATSELKKSLDASHAKMQEENQQKLDVHSVRDTDPSPIKSFFQKLLSGAYPILKVFAPLAEGFSKILKNSFPQVSAGLSGFAGLSNGLAEVIDDCETKEEQNVETHSS